MAEPKHVLLLGGAGFIGQPLLRQLLQEDGARVTLLVHRQTIGELPPGCRIIRGHLALVNLDWCREDPPEVVFHCARLSGIGKTGRLRAALVGNYANRRLVRSFSRFARPPRVIYASGSLMYGSHGEEWVDEQTALRPTSFARQYIIAERPFLKAMGSKLSVMMARPGWVIGNGSWLSRFYLLPAKRTGFVPLYGTGNNWMSFIHREDCAAAIRRLPDAGQPGVAYNLAVAPPMKQREFVMWMAELLQLPVQTQDFNVTTDPAVRDAFESSIKLKTRHQLMHAMTWRFPNPLRALEAALSEHTERIHPDTSKG